MAKIFRNLPCSKHGKSCHDECLGFTVKISGGEFQCPLGLEKVPGAGLANWGLGVPVFVELMSQECFLHV